MSLITGPKKEGSEKNELSADQSIASSALQKAIERNRSKLAQKIQPLEILGSELPEKPFSPIEQKLIQLNQSPIISNMAKENVTESSKLKKVNFIKTKWLDLKVNFFNYFIRLAWLLSLLFFLRLIFVEKGVLEYYLRRRKVEEKLQILASKIILNGKLKKEIERIEKDVAYQKSLVRNNLGFIADDEFIIVLPDSKR